MNAADENLVVAAIERSALAGAIERVARRCWLRSRQSVLLAWLTVACRSAFTRPGITLMTAVVTHLLLQSLVARPPYLYWLIVPAIVAAAAAVLIVVERARNYRSG